jgi:penicillin-binding protein 1A
MDIRKLLSGIWRNPNGSKNVADTHSSYNNDWQNNTTPSPKNKGTDKNIRYYIRLMWWWFVGIIGGIVALFVAVSFGLFGKMPTFTELESPRSALATEVYAADGTLLGKFFVENRTNTTYEELPHHLVEALVSTEDVRFYEHSGIDYEGTINAALQIFLPSRRGGASTITQQLAKNLFHEKPQSMIGRMKQKFKEWIIAIKLERNYTKEEIINMYLNTVEFSNNAHGIKAASRVYFNTSPDSLQLHQAALLVGMLKGPSMYNPIRHPERAKDRRNTVIDQMKKYGNIPADTAQAYAQKTLDLHVNLQDTQSEFAPYFLEYIKQESKTWAKTVTKVDGEPYDIYRDGLKIYTTLNTKMQLYAEQAVHEHMRDLQKQFDEHWRGQNPWDALPKASMDKNSPWIGENELVYRAVKNSERYLDMKAAGVKEADIKKAFSTPTKMNLFTWKNSANEQRDTMLSPLDSIKYVKRFLHTGFLATDPMTGYVLAWVGGIDFRYFKYDNVRVNSKRQAGSTFKPFTYAVAVDNGWSPCRMVPNMPVVFEEYQNWSPQNASSYMNGQMVSLKTGLAFSINRVTAYLMKQVGPQPVVDVARRMGIESPMKPVPSLCLGSMDISVLEMVGAYGTFVNRGFFAKPLSILRVEDKNGNVIQNFTTTKAEAVSEQVAYAMISMLKGVVDFGTAKRLRSVYGLRAEMAGKTGTTNDNSDGWYIGMVPKVCAGAWVGGDEKTIHFRSTALGSGSNMALPIWGKFMTKVYKDASLGVTQNDRFIRPVDMQIELDCYKYSGTGGYNALNPQDSSVVVPNDTTPKKEFDYNNQFD